MSSLGTRPVSIISARVAMATSVRYRSARIASRGIVAANKRRNTLNGRQRCGLNLGGIVGGVDGRVQGAERSSRRVFKSSWSVSCSPHSVRTNVGRSCSGKSSAASKAGGRAGHASQDDRPAGTFLMFPTWHPWFRDRPQPWPSAPEWLDLSAAGVVEKNTFETDSTQLPQVNKNRLSPTRAEAVVSFKRPQSRAAASLDGGKSNGLSGSRGVDHGLRHGPQRLKEQSEVASVGRCRHRFGRCSRCPSPPREFRGHHRSRRHHR